MVKLGVSKTWLSEIWTRGGDFSAWDRRCFS